ncbi:MAG: hypothetical protein WCP20_11365 [Desulfuromonadales bacterium]
MRRVLIFSRDPGGTNTVIPLVAPLRERGCTVYVFGKDTALEKFRLAGIGAVDICSYLPDLTSLSLRQLLIDELPDIVVTGTSADDVTEKQLWSVAAELRIPSMAILDQWANYGIRFSEYGVSEIERYTASKQHTYLPDRIVAMDDYAKREMIAEGLPGERIIVCGQPYFETLFASRQNSDEMARLNEVYALSDKDFVVVFASEPMTQTYGTSAVRHWGYNELTIFEGLVSTLENLARESARRVTLIIRPHPKENRDNFLDLVKGCDALQWRIDTDFHPWTLISRADLVCGMSSIFLVEAVILGTPAMSIQVGLARENPFILDRRGVLKSITSELELRESLRRIIIDGEQQCIEFEVILNPVARIISEMEKIVCKNLP